MRESSVGLLVCTMIVVACGGTAEGIPVLLIYGFQPVPGFRAPVLWTALAERLSGNRIESAQEVVLESGHAFHVLPSVSAADRDVYISDYTIRFEPTMRDLRFYACRVADEIAWITTTTGASRVDLVAHSMGGLIARAYIEAADFDDVLGRSGFPDYGLAYRGDVRTLITLATPHHGMGFAPPGSWFGPLSNQLAAGSDFLRLLNESSDPGDPRAALVPDVRYISLAGQSCLGCGLRRDEADCLRACLTEGIAWRGSDLVVLMESAFLPGAENHPCLGMDHVDLREHPVVCEAIVSLLDGRAIPEQLLSSESLRTFVDD